MAKVNRILVAVLAAVAVTVGSVGVWAYGQYQVPVLMYHHVQSSADPFLNNVTPASFARQMDFIHRHGYRVISMDALVEALKTGQTLRHSVVITFDDGNLDNYTQAFPVLKKYNFPAVEFVPAGFVNVKPDAVTWDQLKDMARAGFVTGSHSYSHKYLPAQSPAQLIKEVKESRELLEKGLGRPVKYFCYPSGGFTREIQQMLREAGYTAACTTNRAEAGSHNDLFALRRIRVNDSDPAIALWAKLSGYYNLFRVPKRSH